MSITVETNLKVADFLGIHLEIVQDIYQQYKKPNDEPFYVNKNSNHPPTVIKQIPKAISKRISDIPSSKEIHYQNINYYKDALKYSGCDNISLPYNLAQQQGQDKIEPEKRKCKIIWFNPPFSMNVKTNVGKTFLKLLQRHFPKRHPMHKMLNRNTVKISYCCMRNMESVTSSRNKQILNPTKENFGCNCRVWNECPLDNNCLTPNIVYGAKVSNKTNNECKRYIGASETLFKKRFKNRSRDFKHENYEKCIELSKYIWALKSHGITPIVKWSIAKRANKKTAANYRKLCLTEKFYMNPSMIKIC